MFLGRTQQGQTVDLYLQCRDANGVATVPDNPPQAKTFSGTALIDGPLLPVIDRYNQPGLFHLPLFLGSSYGEGQYQVVYYYRAGSYHGLRADAFEVMPGGHRDGAITGMYWYRRPQADYVLQSTENGNISVGRNPTLR